MAQPPLAALGGFVFAPSIGSYESLTRRYSQPRASIDVIGAPPVKQWLGPGDSGVEIVGSVWPEIQLPGLYKLDAIAAQARRGIVHGLLLASGGWLGLFQVDEAEATDIELMRWGMPGEEQFRLMLSRV